jgi:hypothetical protein
MRKLRMARDFPDHCQMMQNLKADQQFQSFDKPVRRKLQSSMYNDGCFLIASRSLNPTDIFSNHGAPQKVFHSELFHERE